MTRPTAYPAASAAAASSARSADSTLPPAPCPSSSSRSGRLTSNTTSLPRPSVEIPGKLAQLGRVDTSWWSRAGASSWWRRTRCDPVFPATRRGMGTRRVNVWWFFGKRWLRARTCLSATGEEAADLEGPFPSRRAPRPNPPACVTTCLTMARPRPVPRDALARSARKKRSNSRGSSASATPTPLSEPPRRSPPSTCSTAKTGSAEARACIADRVLGKVLRNDPEHARPHRQLQALVPCNAKGDTRTRRALAPDRRRRRRARGAR